MYHKKNFLKAIEILENFLLYNIYMSKTEIKFGTDGFRGIIAREFTFETVERIVNYKIK